MHVVIVKNKYGYTAHIRTDNPLKDKDISADSHAAIYAAVAREMKKEATT